MMDVKLNNRNNKKRLSTMVMLIDYWRTYFSLCVGIIVTLVVCIILIGTHFCRNIANNSEYKGTRLRQLNGKISRVSKYIIGITADSTENISVPLIGGYEYCISFQKYRDVKSFKRTSTKIDAYMEAYSFVANSFTIYFYTIEASREPLFNDMKQKKSSSLHEYSKYIENNPTNFTLLYYGPFDAKNRAYQYAPSYVPSDYRIVVLTDYLTAYHFKGMIEHFYENYIKAHIVYILPMECLRDMYIETERMAENEYCYMLQRWSKLGNKTGRGPFTQITLEGMTLGRYSRLHNSSYELVEVFYNVFRPVPPYSPRLIVYSSHTLVLSTITDNYVKRLGIKDYYKFNCLKNHG